MKRLLRVIILISISTMLIGCPFDSSSDSNDSNDNTSSEVSGIFVLKFDLDLSTIQTKATAEGLFEDFEAWAEDSTAGKFNIEVTILGTDCEYVYDNNNNNMFLSYTQEEASKDHVIIKAYMRTSDKYPEGPYVVTIRQIGDWGVNFYRQDIVDSKTLYFDIPQIPAIPITITEGNESLLTVFLTPTFSHSE